jgi:hypothetical protein
MAFGTIFRMTAGFRTGFSITGSCGKAGTNFLKRVLEGFSQFVSDA